MTGATGAADPHPRYQPEPEKALFRRGLSGRVQLIPEEHALCGRDFFQIYSW
jgi:hypothetical protein